jgi:hypothetical protein
MTLWPSKHPKKYVCIKINSIRHIFFCSIKTSLNFWKPFCFIITHSLLSLLPFCYLLFIDQSWYRNKTHHDG